MVVALTPYAAATAVLPLAAALLTRCWQPVAAAVAVAVAFAAFLLPRALTDAPPAPAPDGPTLRVLTLNMALGRADARTVVELVRTTGADLLSVQELTPDAARALAEAGLDEPLPHAVVDALPGASGGGLYSRYPLTALPGPTRYEPAMPWAGVEIPGAPAVEVVSVHPFPPLGAAPAREWTAYLEDLPRAEPAGTVRILAGDFNATHDHSAFRDLLASGYTDAAAAVGNGLTTTWPARGSPGLVLDHVLVDTRVRTARTGVHPVPGSDHLAVLADLVLPGD
ncbi:endonuclease/exonuclease/phosphatase family protein [Thermobifida halotolerans]|uniref:Endonuclease/exonuclease/phosphatase family protein n=3 Tax=Thermobifida halotolerans TaxID=483545 RepID=A0AA97M1T2_9ACTN|nr:endonuclease/exonuclease/phosphatase family protein [Thermobifida halotolerans]